MIGWRPFSHENQLMPNALRIVGKREVKTFRLYGFASVLHVNYVDVVDYVDVADGS
jgi:hypothetical protein